MTCASRSASRGPPACADRVGRSERGTFLGGLHQTLGARGDGTEPGNRGRCRYVVVAAVRSPRVARASRRMSSYVLPDETDAPRITRAVQWLIAINVAIYFLQLTVVGSENMQL